MLERTIFKCIKRSRPKRGLNQDPLEHKAAEMFAVAEPPKIRPVAVPITPLFSLEFLSVPLPVNLGK